MSVVKAHSGEAPQCSNGYAAWHSAASGGHFLRAARGLWLTPYGMHTKADAATGVENQEWPKSGVFENEGSTAGMRPLADEGSVVGAIDVRVPRPAPPRHAVTERASCEQNGDFCRSSLVLARPLQRECSST